MGFFKTMYTPVKKIEKRVQNVRKNNRFNIDIPIIGVYLKVPVSGVTKTVYVPTK